VTLSYYFFDTDCAGSAVTPDSFEAEECENIGSDTFKVLCNVDDTSTHQLIHYGNFFCTPDDPDTVVYNFTDGQCIGETYRVTGCPLSVPCTSVVSDYGPWSGTCGDVYRSRTQTCTVSGAPSSPCYTCTNVSLIEHGTIDCHRPDMVTAHDYCDKPIKTCILTLNNTAPFNLLNTFLATGPFSDGWTLLIAVQTMAMSTAFYTVLPALIPFNDIVIASSDSSRRVHLTVATNSITTDKRFIGVCSMFSFAGRNVTLKHVHIIVPSECYDMIPVDRGMFVHGTALQFFDRDITLLDVVIEGAVIGFLINVAGNAGIVSMDGIDIRDTRLLSIAPGNECWAGNVNADAGSVSIKTTPNCTVTVCYGSGNLSVTVSGSTVIDATLFLSSRHELTGTPKQARVPQETNAVIIILSVLLAVVALPVLFYLATVLIHRSGVPLSEVYKNEDISKILNRDNWLDVLTEPASRASSSSYNRPRK
jgi:hypothetical protein